MQAQSRIKAKNKCFFYYNGLMDHICTCNEFKKSPLNGSSREIPWFDRSSQFNGTLVKIFSLININQFTNYFYIF